MATVLIVIHLMVVSALIGLVLLQRSEGGALGVGGGSGGFMTGRGAGNVLTRSTAVLAAIFFVTSVGLALLARIESRPGDILDRLPGQEAPVGAPVPAAPAPATGAPESAQDLLESLGGPSGGAGPQTPPAEAPAAPAPGTAAPAAPAGAPAATAPAPAQPDAAEPAAPPPAPAPGAAAPAPAAPAPATGAPQ